MGGAMPRRDARPPTEPSADRAERRTAESRTAEAHPAEARTAEARPIPRAGDTVYIVHLAARERATILAVHDDGRRLEVRGEEDGATLEFVLSRSTARFVSGGTGGPRLGWA
jgi:hypothetical protein